MNYFHAAVFITAGTQQPHDDNKYILFCFPLKEISHTALRHEGKEMMTDFEPSGELSLKASRISQY